MQVFIIGTPLATAMALDRKRLNKQITECHQILEALNGATARSNHPCVLQYRGYEKWLWYYLSVMEYYYLIDCWDSFSKECLRPFMINWNILATQLTPPFHTQEYFDQMKRRLYTKDPKHYKQWEHLGTSDENWYFVDEEWRKYINGKRIE